MPTIGNWLSNYLKKLILKDTSHISPWKIGHFLKNMKLSKFYNITAFILLGAFFISFLAYKAMDLALLQMITMAIGGALAVRITDILHKEEFEHGDTCIQCL